MPGGGPTWDAMRLPSAQYTKSVRLVRGRRTRPDEVVYSVLPSSPQAGLGYLEGVDPHTGQIKARDLRFALNDRFPLLNLESEEDETSGRSGYLCRELDLSLKHDWNAFNLAL